VLVVAVAAALFFFAGSSDDDDSKRSTSARSDVGSDDASCGALDAVVSKADVERVLEEGGGSPASAVPSPLLHGRNPAAPAGRVQTDSGTLASCDFVIDGGHLVTISMRRPSGSLEPTGQEEAMGGLGDAAIYDNASPRVTVLDRDRDIVLSVSYPSGFAVKTKLAQLAALILDRLPAARVGG
jgi:hypothetical protein